MEDSNTQLPEGLYSYGEVRANNPRPVQLLDHIDATLSATFNDDNGNPVKGLCYIKIEPFISPGGVSGSKSFDQAYAVDQLLVYDLQMPDQPIRAAMRKLGPRLTHRILWDKLVTVLRRSGFRIKNGRMIGLLDKNERKAAQAAGEYASVDPQSENGSPDIE